MTEPWLPNSNSRTTTSSSLRSSSTSPTRIGTTTSSSNNNNTATHGSCRTVYHHPVTASPPPPPPFDTSPLPSSLSPSVSSTIIPLYHTNTNNNSTTATKTTTSTSSTTYSAENKIQQQLQRHYNTSNHHHHLPNNNNKRRRYWSWCSSNPDWCGDSCWSRRTQYSCYRTNHHHLRNTTTTTNNTSNRRKLLSMSCRRTVIRVSIVLFVLFRLSWTFVMFETTLDDISSSSSYYYYKNLYSHSRIAKVSDVTNDTITGSSSSVNNYNNNAPTGYDDDDDDNNNVVRDVDSSSSTTTAYRALLQYYNIPFISSLRKTSATDIDVNHDLWYAIQQERFDPWMLQLENDDDSRPSTATRERGDQKRQVLQRQQRSRPPPLSSSEVMNEELRLPKRMVGNMTTIQITDDDDDNFDGDNNRTINWLELCQRAQLSKSSRIVITNALSSPIGTPLTLLLYHQCQVKSIMIVDAMVPNLKLQRMHHMDTHFRRLYRTISGLKFTVPTKTAGLGKQTAAATDDTSTTSSSSSSMKWLESYRPTHVIHLEDSLLSRQHHHHHSSNNIQSAGDSRSTSSSNLWEDYMTKTGYQLYHIQNSLLSIKQLLYYHQTRATKNILSILHVQVVTPSLSLLNNNGQQQQPHDPQQESAIVKTTMTNQMNHMLADYAQQLDNHNRLLRIHSLQIPYTIYGPLVEGPNINKEGDGDGDTDVVQQLYQNQTSDDSSLLYVDDAIVGILQALQQQQLSDDDGQQQHSSMMALSRSDTSSSDLIRRRKKLQQWQTKVYDHDERYPYGQRRHVESVETNDEYRTEYKTTVTRIHSLYGIYKTRFPCASTCWNNQLYTTTDADIAEGCDASVVDTIYPISESITKDCPYVLYHVNLDVHLDQLFESPKEFIGATTTINETPTKKVCRIAFVAESSVIVRKLINERHDDIIKENSLQDSSGILNVNGWAIILIDGTNERQSGSSIAVDTLLRLEPSRFFASNVKKAMYTDSETIATTSDVALIHIMSSINRPSRTQGYFTREYRSGLENVHRDVYHPPANARSVAFFAAEVEANRPKNLGEYIQQRLTDMTESDIKKSRPINYYKQMSHWIQSDTNRPLRDGIGPLLHVPWIWVNMSFFVHDLRTEAARLFRCTWYDAHLYWGTNNTIPGTEDLSLAYVFAKQRLDGSIGQGLDNDGSWLPQFNQYTHEPTFIGDNTESFLRIMTTGVVQPTPSQP